MIKFILLFFPTFISLYIENNKKKLDKEKLFFMYPIYNIFINLLCIGIIYIYKRGEIISILDNFNILNFCLKYLLIAIIISILIPYIKEFIFKNFKIDVIIRKENKK